MKQKKAKSILEALTEDAARRVDEHCYRFLEAHGYEVENAIKSAKVRKGIAQALKERGEVVYYREVPIENGTLLWFDLEKDDGTLVARSQGIKLMYGKGGQNEEGQSRAEGTTAS